MTLRSMTGFARREGQISQHRWHWELRSVNGRGLDIRLRLPPGTEALEPQVREIAGKRISRGNLSVTLVVQRDSTAGEIKINEAALTTVLAAIERLRNGGDFERPRPEGVLALKGILETGEADESDDARDARHRRILGDFETALASLNDARASEGGRLEVILRDQLASIEDIVARISAAPTRSIEAIRTRLGEQLARILDQAQGFDATRLHQEAALLATRADIAEELDRLRAHIAAARELLAAREPIGRKFDFLTQEFNREANTLCSKSNDVLITRAGLELKAVIDQMREQVQNIE